MAETKDKGTAVALYKAGDYALIERAEELKAVMAENAGANGVGDFDLDRIKVPAGGGSAWTIPTLEGNKSTDILEGVIIAWKEPRSYWKVSFDESGGGSPPDCSSTDGIVGIGAPGGSCQDCPLSKFDTAEKGGGQACRQMRYIFLSIPGSILPYLLIAPPTSLKLMRQYFLRLASAGIPYYGATTKMKLVTGKSKKDKQGKGGGITYSMIEPSMGQKLDPAAAARFRDFGAHFKPQIEASAAKAQAEGAV